MKPIFIHFTDHEGNKVKTFTSTSLKTGMLDNIFDIAERAEAMQKNGSGISEIRSFYRDLKAIIVSVFGQQFTYDELDQNVETKELMRVFQEVCKNITGDMKKN